MDIIAEIKEKAHIEDVIGADKDVKLKKSGGSWKGFCPFHENKHTPALVVYPNSGSDGYFKCWSCGAHGDVIQYVEMRNGVDTREAMGILAERYGIEIKPAKMDMAGRVAVATAADIRRAAMGIFRKWLVGESDRKTKEVIREGDKTALAYALERGWTLETIKQEGIGFSGNATAAEFAEMRGEFSMRGIDPLCPEAVMILGFKGNTAEWAEKYGVDAKAMGENRIYGLMETPGLVFGHKFSGTIEYFSVRFLPEWEEKRGRKSDNPLTVLAGPKRAYRNALYREHHLEGQEKGALLYIVEGQGDGVTNRQFGVPSVALCGSQWHYLVESGEVGNWFRDYEELIYVTDADKAGQEVVTGKDNKFELSNALGAMLWVGRTTKKTWTRPDGKEKAIKDVNDIAQYLMDTKAEQKESNALFNDILSKAERVVVMAAKYAGTLEGKYKEDMVEKIVRPMVLSIPDDKRVNYVLTLADALYPNIPAKADRKTAFNQWLRVQEKSAAKKAAENEDEEHIPTVYTNYDVVKNPKNPDEYWLVDMIFDQKTEKALLAYRDDKGKIGTAKTLDIYGKRYYPKVDDFIRKGVVVLASDLGALVSTRELLKLHEDFLRKSVLFDKSTDYAMASFYSVFSWVYDCFNELPFLRARGGKDTGKSAIMLRIGYVCYRLAKSTGIGSTASLKHAQEAYKCTIFFDEMDIADKFDERIVMLNVRAMKDQANVWSMKKVTDENGDEGYENQAHNVYGPALITMYGAFSDEATDSRCITFDLFGKDISELREKKIPRRLNAAWHEEALKIRNMSLHWRLKNWAPDLDIPEELEDETVSTRANQVTVPIKYIVKDDPIALKEVTETVREMYADEIIQKAQSYEARFLEGILVLTEGTRFDILEFVHEGEIKEYGHAKFIRYPDLAKVVNFLLDEMNSGIAKDVQVITQKETSAPDDEEVTDGDKKGKKKKREASGISTKTVGDHMRKFQLPVKRMGAGYVVIVWSQTKPEDVQGRVGRLKKRFGLEALLDDIETNIPQPVRTPDKAVEMPDDPEFPMTEEQMELYGQMGDQE